MTETEIRDYLNDNGYPPHIVRGGRSGLIQRWREFAAEVERGYEWGLEDYRNDLDIRGVLAIAGADEEVREADERLQSLLTSRESRVWESGAGDPWWDFGFPANATGRLRRDLAASGLWQPQAGAE